MSHSVICPQVTRLTWLPVGFLTAGAIALAIMPGLGCYMSNSNLQDRLDQAESSREVIEKAEEVAKDLKETAFEIQRQVGRINQQVAKVTQDLEEIKRIAAAVRVNPAALPSEGVPPELQSPSDASTDPLSAGNPTKPVNQGEFFERTPPLEDVLASLPEIPEETDEKEKIDGEFQIPQWGDGELTLLIKPLDPVPTLEELDKNVQWQPRPVLNSLEQLEKRIAQERRDNPELFISVEEALKLRNLDDTSNKQILMTLGQLPENDEEVDFQATITRRIAGDVNNLNPLLLSSVSEFEVSGLTGIGLFSFDEDFQPFAAKEAVISWHTSKDGLYDKVVMRDDLTWSDGTRVTAHDVAFSYKAIMTKEVPVRALRSGTNKMRWVHAYDDQTVVFFHRESLATNIWNINFSLIPKHIYEKTLPEDPELNRSDRHLELEADPVTGGAYTVASRVRASQIVLERREGYYMFEGRQVRDKPFFKRIIFKIVQDENSALISLKAGEIEEMELTPDQWTSQTSGEEFYSLNTKGRGLEWVYFYLGWNNKSKYFQDRRTRQAMSYAIDYDEMLNVKLKGLYPPSNGPFHETSWMAFRPSLDYYKQDVKKAKQLLKEAGWGDEDNDGFLDKRINGTLEPFEFELLVRNAPLRISLCKGFAQDWEKLGIRAIIKPLESATLQEKMFKKQFDAAFGGWGTGADPDTASNVWESGEARNFVDYSNETVDRLFKGGAREFDLQKRASIYAHIHREIYEDQPYTFLYVRPSLYGFNKSIRGLRFSPRGPYGYSPGFGSLWKSATY